MREIKERLEYAYSFATKDNYKKAISICDDVIREHPSLPDGLTKRAAIYAHMGDLRSAIDDITFAIEIEPHNPTNYFFRGWWSLDYGNNEQAIQDLSMALKYGGNNDHFHDESAYFFRSIAYLRLGQYNEVLSDCSNVRDDFIIHIKSEGRISKDDIVRKAVAG